MRLYYNLWCYGMLPIYTKFPYSIDIGLSSWYGGPEELVQHFPMRRENSRERVPYLPGDMLQDSKMYFGGVTEPFWINSLGGGLVVEQEQPLFYSWNSGENDKLCLSVEHALPYVSLTLDFVLKPFVIVRLLFNCN